MNTLFIISAPSGAGKSKIAKSVMKNEIVSFTTRAPREGEVHGIDYLFIRQEEFDRLLANGGLAEYTTYYGNASYGITMNELTSKLEKGDAFVIVDVVGMEQLKKLHPKTVTIFIQVPTEMLEGRMRKRGDSEELIAKRLRTVEQEQENFYLYDYVIDNSGKLEDAIEAFKTIVGGGNFAS